MCSICGGNYPLEAIKKASKTMAHRGPNFSGVFSEKGIALAHNRLSIIDLEKEANQPFISSYCPHFVLVFNGEIYNYLELREELEGFGVAFQTKSDTEVLLHAFAFWGEKCLEKFNGDFAFVVYDRRDSSLFFARDRLGNKPLFYGLHGDRICFASEIKALLEILPQEFDLEEVAKWLLFSNGSKDKTIYKGIMPFLAAHYGVFKDGKLKLVRYWNLEIAPQHYTLDCAVEELETLLLDALKLRLRSDVQVALSVSGGVDSSILAHLIKRLNGDCKFFGLGFRDFKNIDESAHIREIGRDIKEEICEVALRLEDCKKDFAKLVCAQDEIFRSFSIYAQFALFKEIAKECKVVLSGQGADELFGGYYHHIGRYIFMHKEAFKDRLRIYGKEALEEYMFGLKCSLDKELKLQLFAEDNAQNLRKLEQMGLPKPPLENLLERFLLDFNKGLWLDVMEFNLPNLLRYEDRDAMTFSLENRTPFTDYRVVEFAFRLPEGLKVACGYGKYILRVILERLGSKNLAWRLDKKGFSAPEREIAQTLGYNFQGLFDVRSVIFQQLRNR
ncbi:asparagine synthase (glutamine-hydrolyzing) [Helicobacter turcicus]|uniref:asparagine synthase (glutamine-hydrolyzing) n=1 Tax=Helicobacter turcicus TaxID=2867412 RepID=A0ABS7JQ18_9HELI|nr:asparagine synthase (glutamine-hydrolyzing) [Helicobacter turcicus]MBX7491500.1 asparagine synthase (glutamine-hydrolyzing) [Helicobacter turcicus]MBX7546356.1 asparagine synthase (glutamine-hydrolyzing) [Helicobacter turcicus]